jgi:signal transduction histidine kinase
MKMHLSIKQRIYWSFCLLVVLFVASAVLTILTQRQQKELSERLSGVVNPSLRALDEFKEIILKSKMYTTNWVFLRYKEEDKQELKRLHISDYHLLKDKLNSYSKNWTAKNWKDSMDKVFKGFEELLGIEKTIMVSLNTFKDYDDPVIKLEAERKVEEEVFPRTTILMDAINTIYNRGLVLRTEQGNKVEYYSMKLRMFIVVLLIAIVGCGIFLSTYMTKVIVAPINRISHIINDLGKGITRKIEDNANADEISKMVRSVNNLSDKLQATANFAQEVGMRNFNVPFLPLSEEDTLGKALITMRTNLRRGEISLESKNKELERKNKELEQFAYVASHDLQEPLRTISSFVDLLQQQYGGKLDDKADKYLNYIVHSSSRMSVLITDLLEYSRIGRKNELEQVDCNVLLKEVLADLSMAVNETGAEIVAGPLPVFYGYATELKQLFQNLIFNAIKFRKKNIAPLIRITASKQGDYWQFAFADNGIGIAKEHYDRIFIIFQRLHTRNEYPGSGIGLSHCRKIVELHKGRIWLESEQGKGTTFYFTIQYNNQ